MIKKKKCVPLDFEILFFHLHLINIINLSYYMKNYKMEKIIIEGFKKMKSISRSYNWI